MEIKEVKEINKDEISANNKRIIKIGVIVGYGEENAKSIINSLRSENTKDKLNNIEFLINNVTIKDEELLFIIQKLLALPKSVRFSIANQVENKLKENNKDE